VNTAAAPPLLAPAPNTTAWQATTAEEACSKLGVIAEVTLLNAILGPNQEGKAAESVAGHAIAEGT
jgi:hypothetical protein